MYISNKIALIGKGIVLIAPESTRSDVNIGDIIPYEDEYYEVKQIDSFAYTLASLPDKKGIGLIVKKL